MDVRGLLAAPGGTEASGADRYGTLSSPYLHADREPLEDPSRATGDGGVSSGGAQLYRCLGAGGLHGEWPEMLRCTVCMYRPHPVD